MGFVTRMLLTMATMVAGADAGLNITVTNTGRYSIAVNGVTWLQSGPTFFNVRGQTWSTEPGNSSLILRTIQTKTGSESNLGNYVEHLFTYGAGNTSIVASLKSFSESSVVFFTQTFPQGASQTRVGAPPHANNHTISGFPSFKVQSAAEPLGFLSYGGYMMGFTELTSATWDDNTASLVDGNIGGPLAIFNSQADTVVISPLNHFMAASLWHDRKPGGHVSWGIMGGVNEVPSNFSYTTVLAYGRGINRAFSYWGDVLQTVYGKTDSRDSMARNDVSLNYLGYWTDNGAYYYYNSEGNKTYQDTLLDVKAYADSQNIPYRYLQLDSWWYPKDKVKAVTEWVATPTAFPDGIKYVNQQTSLRFAAHNRYWSKGTSYAKQNNGSFTFVMGQEASLPHDINFWRYLFMTSKQWGLAVYEQDWLNIQFRHVEALQTSVTLGRDWLTQMGQAASELDISIQYCMALPRHALQSLEIPAVTQIRVSGDYLYPPTEPQWKIGVTSMFARALRLKPFKDTFWTRSREPGNPYNRSEVAPALEAVIASLSTGPVGPGDRIGSTDRELLMRCCRSDGLILKPSHPATAIDRQIITDAFAGRLGSLGEVWSTSSFIRTGQGQEEYGLMFAADIQVPTAVTVRDLGFQTLTTGMFYPYNNIHHLRRFNDATSIDVTNCSKLHFCLYHFIPILPSKNVSAFLGETNKWIPVSPQRVYEIDTSAAGDVSVTLSGAMNESVTMAFLTPYGVQELNCTFNSSQLTTAGTGHSACALTIKATPLQTASPSSRPLFSWTGAVVSLGLAFLCGSVQTGLVL